MNFRAWQPHLKLMAVFRISEFNADLLRKGGDIGQSIKLVPDAFSFGTLII